ncbi:MAG: DUF4317 domain-containing protein [Lachnospiraceae bacterium]|jgi:hypothetical protein|nr:DUF4317 domain-containing protein [Lachnospiraceae bacterium]
MVTKKDILELKRRMKKEDCTFTRINGCYVDANKEKLVTFSENFLNLDEEEFHKYLEIAKKALSGTIGNNVLELHFEKEETESGGLQQYFLGLRDSRLKNPELLDRLYDQIIEHYDYTGNYLILLFHDVYDVITKTSDNLKIDESEEVFEYLLCAICPVNLSKPGLGYLKDENRIGPRVRDWVVGVPDAGFLFPSFSDRSTDIHSITYYVKDAKDSHPDFVASVLGCGPKRTATEQKKVFTTIVKTALAPIVDDTDEVLLNIQENLNSRMEQEEESAAESEEPMTLSRDTITDVLKEMEISNDARHEIEEAFSREFAEQLPQMEALIDTKALEANAKVKQQQELVKQVHELQKELVDKELADAGVVEDADVSSGDTVKTYDVVLRVKPEKANQIKSQVVNGQKCLIIPMDEGEYVNVNGINTQV